MGMMFFWIAAVALLVWYVVKHQAQRQAWVWIVAGLLALPLLGMSFGGHGMMGGFGGRGMMGGWSGPGHMGFRGPGGFGGVPVAPGQVPGPGAWGGYWGGHGMLGAYGGTYWWVAMAIRAVLLIGGIVLVYFLVKRYWKPAPAVTPLGELQLRLAKGEITAQEFEDLRKKIEA